MGALILAVPAAAEDAVLDNGEPTDPEKMMSLVELSDIDLDDYGIASQTPTSASVVDSWVEAVVNLLRTLGVLPAEDASR